MAAPDPSDDFPDQPVLARVWRGDHVESQHRGTWALADVDGKVLEGAGEYRWPVFARSAIKCLQALPLVESGAAERFAYDDRDLALALASHSGEARHTDGVRGILARLDLDIGALQCGPQVPDDPEARAALTRSGQEPSAIHNNCSGKHAGFLALARHLGQDPDTYLDPAGEVQRRVRRAVGEVAGLGEDQLQTAMDGCSAPTFRMPLVALARAFARMSHPASLPSPRAAAATRMLDAVAAHPGMIAGRHRRLCTDLARVSGGALFPKVGAEAVYAVGIRGTGQALAVKLDDGGAGGVARALPALVIALLDRLGFLEPPWREGLAPWRGAVLRNRSRRPVGRLEVLA